MIIDAEERPDLLQLVRQDQLRMRSCPSCGAEVSLPPTLLLLYRPSREPSLVIGVPPGDEPFVQDVGNSLLSQLRDALGPAWRDEWLQDIAAVPWDVLITALQSEAQADLVAAGLNSTNPEVRLAMNWRLAEDGARFAYEGDLEARAFAIEHYTAALADATESDLAAQLHNSLARLYIEVRSPDFAADMEAAVAHAREALAASDAESSSRAFAYMNLGSALIDRIEGDRALALEEAIDAMSKASVQLASLEMDEQRAKADLVLGHALVERIVDSPGAI